MRLTVRPPVGIAVRNSVQSHPSSVRNAVQSVCHVGVVHELALGRCATAPPLVLRLLMPVPMPTSVPTMPTMPHSGDCGSTV